MGYKIFNRFILRTPSVSFTHFQSTLANDEYLLKNFTDFRVQEALYLASPVLYNELKKLLDGSVKDNEEARRIISSVVRYFTRMSTRCTPFGLFAGCTLGKIGHKTDMRLDRSFDRKTRLDMYYLYSLYDDIVKKNCIRENMDYYPNTSIYPIEKKYRYIEHYRSGTQRQYQISEVQRSKYLNKILKKISGNTNYKLLIDLITCDGISKEDAVDYINELIDSQLLVGLLNQSVTGSDFLSRLISLLRSTENEEKLLSRLIEISILLEKLDKGTKDLNTYSEITNLIKANNIPYEENCLFQVDIMPRASTIELGEDVIDELKSTLIFLNKITPKYSNQTLEQFKSDFYNRYETKEVPLMTALDPELGIGYPADKNERDISPLLDDFIIPSQNGKTPFVLGAFDHILLDKVNECQSFNKKEIILTDTDVKDLNCDWGDLPPTMYTMFKVLSSDEKNILINVNSCSGSCGANLISRFSHLNAEIEQFVRDITIKEQELMPDVVLSEIVHMPTDRVGNILLRPHLREYELLYMANSDLPEEHLIYLSDLMLSIKNNKLYLRSKKLNKEIIPRLTSAHNYFNNTMPVYHFLCDMQMQSIRGGISFSWKSLENIFSCLPRVRYKNTILSPALWTIRIEELNPYFSIKKEEEMITKISEWRKKIDMPRYVLLSDGDNELFVDWKNPVSVRSLFSIIKKRSLVKFYEFLFDADKAVVKDDKGDAYLNECIVCFHKDHK